MTPADLMKAILLAPVDLLWNGGIGTYVKASTETNAEIGDRANDAIRVNGNALRCKVIGEGGNLGASQLGPDRGGPARGSTSTPMRSTTPPVSTPPTTRSTSRSCSTAMTREGDMTLKQRNALLASMTDDVAHQVLRDNYEQNVLLGNARAQEHAMLPVHERLIRWLEERGDLDRSLEFLPSDSELTRRHDAGVGLTSPEFSVLVAYAKLALKADLLPTALPDEPWFQSTLADYFPRADPRAVPRPAGQPPAAPRDHHELGGQLDGQPGRHHVRLPCGGGDRRHARSRWPVRSWSAARCSTCSSYVAAVEELDNVVSTDAQTELYLEFRRLLDRSVRWFLQNRPSSLDVGAEVERFRPVVTEHGSQMLSLLQGQERQRLERRIAELESAGAPERDRAPGRPGCSTATRCSTWSRSAARPDATRARSRRCTSRPPSSSGSTRC